MNEYDSAQMANLLEHSHDLQTTEHIDAADVLLLNTCSIRAKAEEKVFSELGRWRELKKKKPHLLIGVGGCVASQEGQAILRRAPYVDLIFKKKNCRSFSSTTELPWRSSSRSIPSGLFSG